MASDVDDSPSGSSDFDHARALLADARVDEALDLFEMASMVADDPAVRASACAYAAGVLLSVGRPWEVPSFAGLLRDNGGSDALASLLEASAKIQLEDVPGAQRLLDSITEDPTDVFFPCSRTVVELLRAHVHYLEGETDRARVEVLDAFARDPLARDVWDAFARLCAETDFDPAPVVAQLADDRVLDVLAWLRSSEAAGVDRIAELIWARDPGDARVLALVPSFAAQLESTRALQWSARLRAVGMGRLCPLLARADDVRVEAPERARAAALAYASFGDKRGRESLELAVPALEEDALPAVLDEVWTVAPALTDSVVVAGATTARRSMLIAAALCRGGAPNEAYAVLVHGLSMEDAEQLTTDDVIALLPVAVLEELGSIAETRGEHDVAGILQAVAVVAGSE